MSRIQSFLFWSVYNIPEKIIQKVKMILKNSTKTWSSIYRTIGENDNDCYKLRTQPLCGSKYTNIYLSHKIFPSRSFSLILLILRTQCRHFISMYSLMRINCVERSWQTSFIFQTMVTAIANVNSVSWQLYRKYDLPWITGHHDSCTCQMATYDIKCIYSLRQKYASKYASIYFLPNISPH